MATPQCNLETLPGESFELSGDHTRPFKMERDIREYGIVSKLGIMGMDKTIDILQGNPQLADLKSQAFETLFQMDILPSGVGVAFGETSRVLAGNFLDVALHAGQKGNPFSGAVGEPIAHLYLDHEDGKAYIHPASSQDQIAPAAPNDLSVTEQDQKKGLSWTSTGDDHWSGRARSFEVRVSDKPFTDLGPEEGKVEFHEAMPVSKGRAGETGAFDSTDLSQLSLEPGKTYHAGLRILDEACNSSPLSTVTFQA